MIVNEGFLFNYFYFTLQVSDQAGILKQEALKIISKRAEAFSDDIYFVALYLSPKRKSMAISKKKNYKDIRNGIVKLLFNWDFSRIHVSEVLSSLDLYENNVLPFTKAELDLVNPREFWKELVGHVQLRALAIKLFSIVPHSAEVERLFSSLGMIKSKSRNKLEIENLRQIAFIK